MCLRGEGPDDLMEVTRALGEQMLLLAGAANSEAEARDQLQQVIADGSALGKFREIVAAQGGDVAVVDHPERLPQARLVEPVAAEGEGVVQEVDAYQIALAAMRLGAGRAKAEDHIDPAVGVDRLVKVGERVRRGQPLCRLHANDEAALADARAQVLRAVRLGSDLVDTPPLVAGVVS